MKKLTQQNLYIIWQNVILVAIKKLVKNQVIQDVCNQILLIGRQPQEMES